MNNCAEFIELISAYADGELSEPDNCRVMEHIGACKSCSALLDIYREISAAVDESAVPAPEALRIGVMERVLSDDAVPAPGNARKHTPFRLILLRYAPIAACLTLILLAIPWITNTPNGSRSDRLEFEPAFEAPMPGSMDAEVAENDSMDADGFFYGAFGGSILKDSNNAPPPEASSAAEGSAEIEIAQNKAATSRATDQYTTAGVGEQADAPMAAPDAAFDLGGAQRDDSDSQTDFLEDPMEPFVIGGDTPALMPEEAPMPTAGSGLYEAPGDVLDLLSDFGDAYAWIEITGALPKLLGTFDPEPLDGWLNWDMYYEIPIDTAQKLINEISGRTDTLIIYNNDSGNYAIVLYSPGE